MSKLSKNMAVLMSSVKKDLAFMEQRFNPNNDDEVNSNAGVYIFTYIKDPKYVYIGRSNDFQRRWNEHIRDFISKKHCGNFGSFFEEKQCEITDFNWRILKAIPKENKEEIEAAEKFFISKYRDDEKYILLNSIQYKNVGGN